MVFHSDVRGVEIGNQVRWHVDRQNGLILGWERQKSY